MQVVTQILNGSVYPIHAYWIQTDSQAKKHIDEKWTVSVISSDPIARMTIPDLKRYPSKVCPIK